MRPGSPAPGPPPPRRLADTAVEWTAMVLFSLRFAMPARRFACEADWIVDFCGAFSDSPYEAMRLRKSGIEGVVAAQATLAPHSKEGATQRPSSMWQPSRRAPVVLHKRT